MEFLSPLRYPGGKAKVSDFVQCLIKENALLDGIYVEPYVGGGSVALSLLFNEYVKDIYINDKDIAIYAFWHSVLYEPEALCKLRTLLLQSKLGLNYVIIKTKKIMLICYI
mgnify:CR=1 FL=1